MSLATTAVFLSLLTEGVSALPPPPPPPAAPGDAVVFAPHQKPASWPSPESVIRVGTRGLDAYKATCIASAKAFEAMETIAAAAGLRKATEDELRQLNDTAVHSRQPVVKAVGSL